MTMLFYQKQSTLLTEGFLQPYYFCCFIKFLEMEEFFFLLFVPAKIAD
jgi:hypothetical protein